MSGLRILAISGSLRANSLNTALLKHAAVLSAQHELTITLDESLKQLPLFNPDVVVLPSAAQQLYESICVHDVILIASPEYAHGISGPMKNALDWMVATDSFVNKPTVLWNASPRATIAQAALAEVLQTMSAHLLTDAYTVFPILGSIQAGHWQSSTTLDQQIHTALSQLKQATQRYLS